MKKINPCLIARARANRAIERLDRLARVNRYSDGQLIGYRFPEETRRLIKEAGADALSVEVEWDGAYSIVPASGDRVINLPDEDTLRGFLNVVFGRVVRIDRDTVHLVPWNELLPANPKPSSESEDSYW